MNSALIVFPHGDRSERGAEKGRPAAVPESREGRVRDRLARALILFLADTRWRAIASSPKFPTSL